MMGLTVCSTTILFQLAFLTCGSYGGGPPVQLLSAPIISVDESTPVGSKVYQFGATNPGSHSLSYSLRSMSQDTADFFSINNVTGALYLRKLLDIQNHPKFEIQITADGGPIPATVKVWIIVKSHTEEGEIPSLSSNSFLGGLGGMQAYPGDWPTLKPTNKSIKRPSQPPLGFNPVVPVESQVTFAPPTQWGFAGTSSNRQLVKALDLSPPVTPKTTGGRNRIMDLEAEDEERERREKSEKFGYKGLKEELELEKRLARERDGDSGPNFRFLAFLVLIVPIAFSVWLWRRCRHRDKHINEKLAVFKSVSADTTPMKSKEEVCLTVSLDKPGPMKKSLLAPTWSNGKNSYQKRSGSSTTTLQSGSDGYLEPDVPVQVWEVSRERIRTLNLLGEGCFGLVFKAEATEPSGEVLIVAVKTLKNNAIDKEKRDLLNELDLMKSMEPHPNVVQLLGCCTKHDPIYVIMEFVALGKLLSVLRRSRNSHYYGNLTGEDVTTLTSQDLTSFGFQVARGMEYLSSKGILHRDLAARNILVDQNLVCKVSDFGLARDIIDDHIYERKSEGRLPIRWMAPESLFDNIFSTQSDVWSFGILLWEIATLGSTPYPGIKGWRQVMDRIRSGDRLPQPQHCKREFYNIMYYCWEADPAKRTTFTDLASDLGRLLAADQDYLDLNHFPDNNYENAIISEDVDEKV